MPATRGQRQMLGQSPGEGTDPGIAAAQEQLLKDQYDVNILPVLNNATSNCLIAELGFTKAADWARNASEQYHPVELWQVASSAGV